MKANKHIHFMVEYDNTLTMEVFDSWVIDQVSSRLKKVKSTETYSTYTSSQEVLVGILLAIPHWMKSRILISQMGDTNE